MNVCAITPMKAFQGAVAFAVTIAAVANFRCSNDGIVTCFNLQTGEIYYEERIGGGG